MGAAANGAVWHFGAAGGMKKATRSTKSRIHDTIGTNRPNAVGNSGTHSVLTNHLQTMYCEGTDKIDFELPLSQCEQDLTRGFSTTLPR
jgi:hypothetical protein